MNKKTREAVYKKYDGHCAYCGKQIEYKDMQVDHIIPQRASYVCIAAGIDLNGLNNLNPSCRRCNHYKRGHSLEGYRELLMDLHERVADIYICKVAEDYGVIKIEPWDGKFYFEKLEVRP